MVFIVHEVFTVSDKFIWHDWERYNIIHVKSQHIGFSLQNLDEARQMNLHSIKRKSVM